MHSYLKKLIIMLNKERFFVNPYPDYNKKENCSIQDLIEVEFWKNWALEKGLYCLEKSKPIAAEKYCEGNYLLDLLYFIFSNFIYFNYSSYF